MKRITSTALFTLAVLVTAALVPGTGAMAQDRAVRDRALRLHRRR